LAYFAEFLAILQPVRYRVSAKDRGTYLWLLV
jgi:hypothetical protein